MPFERGETKPGTIHGPSIEKLLDRAREAESAGKRELALAYLRTARDQGSIDATNEIDRLRRKKQ